MKLSLFSIKDNIAGEFGPVWLSKNEVTAMRQYKTHLSTLAEHMRDDFDLYQVGDFDNDDGSVQAKLKVVSNAAN